MKKLYELDNISNINGDMFFSVCNNYESLSKISFNEISKYNNILVLHKDDDIVNTIIYDNYIYLINNDFDLRNEILNLPNNSLLIFTNCKLSNGKIINNNSKFYSNGSIIFDTNIILENFDEIHADWFIGNDNDLLPLFTYIQQNIHNKIDLILDSKEYSCILDEFILLYTSIKGNGKDKTIIKVTSNNENSSFALGIGYLTQLYDLSLILTNNKSIDLTRFSNDNSFFPTDYVHYGAYKDLIINNVSFETQWDNNVGSDLSGYLANGLSIIFNDKDTLDNINKCYSMSYIRNICNLKCKYFNIGININISQNTSNLANKIWVNSFLLKNIEIWSNVGIDFNTYGVDSDTGYFTFDNYFYQGHANGYGYKTNNGARNSIINFIAWDTNTIIKIDSGTLFIPYLSKDSANKILGVEYIDTNFAADNLSYKSKNYDSYSGAHKTKIFSEPDTKHYNYSDGNIKISNVVKIKPESTVPNAFKFVNRQLSTLTKSSVDAEFIVTDYNDRDIISDKYKVYNVNNENCELYNKYNRQEYIIEHTENLYNGANGQNYESILYAYPHITNNVFVKYLPYNTIIISANMTFSTQLEANSRYKLVFYPTDANGNKVDWADKTDEIKYTDIAVIPSANINWRNNSSGYSITNNRLIISDTSNDSYIDIDIYDKPITYINLTFIITSNYKSGILRTNVSKIVFNTPSLVYLKYGTSANKPTLTTFPNMPIGFNYYATDLGKPIYHSGNNTWKDATGKTI